MAVVPTDCLLKIGELTRNALRAACLLVPEPQNFLCGIEQITEQLALPPVPHPWPHRSDIHHGQREQQAQTLGRLHVLGEIEHSLEV